jgi:hypothetical protein
MTHPDDRSLTIAQFCALEQLSRASYFKLQRNGLGPVELRAPGCAFVRITPQARIDWHKKMAEAQASQQAKQERNRRVAIARRAGERAAQSAKHACRTGRNGKRRSA